MIITVVGPTAAGKSDLALALAEHLGGEIVNADSMQLYIGMDIGTAKPEPAERARIPHHLLDIWPVTATASVAIYQQLARAAIGEIEGRERIAILVGGSGLYIRAAIDPLEFPGTDPQIRARLLGEVDELGPGVLHARLADLDPAAAAGILPSNGRRIVRALEVIELTGRSYSATMPGYPSDPAVLQLGVDRDDLDTRIDTRVDRMWEQGFVAEVRSLIPAGIERGVTASRALGYAQILRQLAGQCSEDEARAETARATRRFARRQRSWFRRDPRIRWIRQQDPIATAIDLVERWRKDTSGEHTGIH